jgi:hypothetical protein
MLTSEDRTRMSADFIAIRDDRPVSIAIRRNGATLAAQTVRIARGGNIQAGTTDTDGLQAAVGAVVVVGDVALDIQPNDKFTVSGALYEVIAIHPNRDHGTQAQARQVH